MATKILKRKVPAVMDRSRTDEDAKADAAPKSARKNGKAKPLPRYCFASLVKGFDLTSVQCKPCADKSHPDLCEKGLRVTKSDLSNSKAVVKSLYNFESKVSREILSQLKGEK